MLEVLRLIQTCEFKSRSSLAKPDQKSHLFSYFNITCNEYKKTRILMGDIFRSGLRSGFENNLIQTRTPERVRESFDSDQDSGAGSRII